MPRDLTQAQSLPALNSLGTPATVAMPAPSAGPLSGGVGAAMGANGADGAALGIAGAGLGVALPNGADGWIGLLELQAARMLSDGQVEVMDVLGRQFESALIRTALKHTHGRKNDAAIRLGIGRNTITRKIAELGIDGAKDE